MRDEDNLAGLVILSCSISLQVFRLKTMVPGFGQELYAQPIEPEPTYIFETMLDGPMFVDTDTVFIRHGSQRYYDDKIVFIGGDDTIYGGCNPFHQNQRAYGLPPRKLGTMSPVGYTVPAYYRHRQMDGRR
jgi:hypothetical protein